MLGEDAVGVAVGVGEETHQAEIAQLHEAVLVQEDVRGFEVAVQHLGAVEVFQRFRQLVADEFLVGGLQDVLADRRV